MPSSARGHWVFTPSFWAPASLMANEGTGSGMAGSFHPRCQSYLHTPGEF